MHNPVIVGDRVYLRPMEEGDNDAQARYSAAETETMMDRWRMPFSPIAFEQFLDKLYTHLPPSDVVFAVCLANDDTMIGVVELNDIDWIHRTAETGSWIGDANYRGKGFGTEAKHLLLEYAFDHIQLHALHAWVIEPNTRSSSALAKQGYRLAGRQRWVETRDGAHIDALMYDVLRDDWVAARDTWRASRGD
ncbi:MAG TPA: GNAT family protein [Thermomicrobiales bacterium]|nr:GNAT family protein [Thermomicrobiales bacterium]